MWRWWSPAHRRRRVKGAEVAAMRLTVRPPPADAAAAVQEDARAPCVLPKLFGARCTIDFSRPMRKILRGGAGVARREEGAECGGHSGRGAGGVQRGGATRAVPAVGQTVGRRRHCESVTTARGARSPHRDMFIARPPRRSPATPPPVAARRCACRPARRPRR